MTQQERESLLNNLPEGIEFSEWQTFGDKVRLILTCKDRQQASLFAWKHDGIYWEYLPNVYRIQI